MDILTKYEVTVRNREPSNLKEKILWTPKLKKYLWSAWIINWFRDQFNEEVYDILTIDATDEQMEFFWSSSWRVIPEESFKKM